MEAVSVQASESPLPLLQLMLAPCGLRVLMSKNVVVVLLSLLLLLLLLAAPGAGAVRRGCFPPW
jgi:hypothetical protein